MTFQRPEHRIIAALLHGMDAELLSRCGCYFGGGTAIVLQNGEYRLSRDVDFLCASVDGFREVRTILLGRDPARLLGPSVGIMREFRADQYGIRAGLSLHGQAIRFEIVREARIPLNGGIDPALTVPVLGVAEQFAEKLLANADRGLDRSTAFRDAIDLGFLVARHGTIPPAALALAHTAYGADIPHKLALVLRLLADPDTCRGAAGALGMRQDDVWMATAALGRAFAHAWPGHPPPDTR